jgi:dsRNA-specific ribonuclease
MVPGLGGRQPDQLINDFVISDVVEALIGACYLHSKKLTSELMVKVFAFFGLNYDMVPREENNQQLNVEDELRQRISGQTENIEQLASHIEKKMSYKFRNLRLLREAFTHPSACRYHRGYQRLEFLGINKLFGDMTICIEFCSDT